MADYWEMSKRWAAGGTEQQLAQVGGGGSGGGVGVL